VQRRGQGALAVQRRGVAAMHRRAGLPLAVNAGDAMNALAMRLFRGSGQRLAPATVLRILDEVDHLLVESLEGQAMELGWTRDNHLAFQPDDYMLLVLKKTAWYSFIHPLRIGALVADGKDEDLGRFDQFGFLLGLAFQITDDVLNLNGESTSYGKEIDGDLWEGKRTLILSHGLSQVTAADRQWMEGFLAKPRERRLPRDVMRMHNLLELSGSMNWADQVAKAFTEAAIVEFETRAFAGVAAGPDLSWLRSCIDYLVQRQV
jgi:geranylgeranyl pyrophosphate synthase